MLLLILGELSGEINYIIVKFLEYDSKFKRKENINNNLAILPSYNKWTKISLAFRWLINLIYK